VNLLLPSLASWQGEFGHQWGWETRLLRFEVASKVVQTGYGVVPFENWCISG